MQESLDVSKLFVFPGQQTPAAAASQLRRSSVDSLSRSRRGSSDMAPRLRDLEAQVDDKVTIACIVHGHPKPEVAWHKDGVLLLPEQPRHLRWGACHGAFMRFEPLAV
uniref:Ig-like domain-containing protein n=1 Tax=Macrostomum lignano TaxID=282301 RepID=A0A1I8GNU4_9PLAT